MEPAVSLIIAISAVVICITAFGIYTAFGPPAKNLQDPFDMHED